MNFFNEEQRAKVEKLINTIDDEFHYQTTRSDSWGVNEPDMRRSGSKLGLRPLDMEHTEDWWDPRDKAFKPRYDKWGVLKKQYWKNPLPY